MDNPTPAPAGTPTPEGAPTPEGRPTEHDRAHMRRALELARAAGKAGERFCVRNSGATAVVEGCGSNGCEYMTGGAVAILGPVGDNFGAGMTGGMAYLYDPHGEVAPMMNMETLVTCPVTVDHWIDELEGLIERHLEETGSAKAADILQHWDVELGHFLQVCPKEMLVHLPAPLSKEASAVPAE